jgi:hypothetical protein
MQYGETETNAVIINNFAIWDIKPSSPLKVVGRFGGTCRLHLQDRRISQARNQREAGRKKSGWFLSWLILGPRK